MKEIGRNHHGRRRDRQAASRRGAELRDDLYVCLLRLEGHLGDHRHEVSAEPQRLVYAAAHRGAEGRGQPRTACLGLRLRQPDEGHPVGMDG